MTATEFSASEEAALIVDRLDPHRQRQVLAFIAERYGFSLQPSPRKVVATRSHNIRSEFAAIENIAELWDGLTDDQRKQAIATLAARFTVTTAAAYKPPAKSYGTRRRKSM